MKGGGGRSTTRLQSTHDPHEDWGDGSWTVDCVCGVNFDDGEEMVNCDECGVWVHTRCSKYVKSEESFACDKCKINNSNNRINNQFNNNNDDSEETEVAQLLVELPTKTIRLDTHNNNSINNNGNNNNGFATAANGTHRRPIRLWTDRPMEDRVHVQGIPGGDPGLFDKLSPVFTQQLWKCTGYVPKRFSFRYREFPCWEDEKEEEENGVDNGAGVLFSLSKESLLGKKVAMGAAVLGAKDVKKWEGEDRDVRQAVQIGVKRERSLLQPVAVHSGKRKKEDLGDFGDRSGKKKTRSVDKEMDSKKKVSHGSKISAFTSTSDAKPLEFYEDRGPKGFKNDMQSIKNKNATDQIIEEHESNGHGTAGNHVEKHKNNSAMARHSLEVLSSDNSRHVLSTGAEPREEKVNSEMSPVINSPPKIDIVDASALDSGDTVSISVKLEGDSKPNGNWDDNPENFTGIDVKCPVDGVHSASPEVEGKSSNGHGETSLTSVQPDVMAEVNNDNPKGVSDSQTSLAEAKDPGIYNDNVSENSKINDPMLHSSPIGDHKSHYIDRTSEAFSDSHTEKFDELSGDACRKQEFEGSEGSLPLQKCPSEPKCGSGFAEEVSNSVGTAVDSTALASQRNMVVCVGKLSSSSSTILISKSSVSDNLKAADTVNSNPDAKPRVISECTSSIKKERAASDVDKDADRDEIYRKTVKERPPSGNTVSKASKSSKISHAHVPKGAVSDSKDSLMFSSSKPSSAQNSAETSGLLQNDTSHVQNKAMASGLPLRGEKFNQTINQSSSKANHASSMNPHAPTNLPATLSDEELALLLHQELNSSPRVPRVPRVRQAGCLPQLTSPTATSMLIKRTSSSGGKDHSSVSRRKNREASKDGFRRSCNPDDESRKTERVAPLPDQRRHETGYSTDSLLKREDYGSPAAVNTTKKNVPPTSTSTANSGPSSSTEVNDHHLSSTRDSLRNVSDEEAGTVSVPVHRTLPGLINEIMSKGRRMTGEELCNAVLPHWHNLRKHNGERYAYTSPSQAVSDCLRNRQEWSRLVDRGPKTNSSRKKRRFDAEESEDNDYVKGRTAESKSLESQKEEFPKGKRKARKRRRLALQGRGIKDVRNKRKAGMLTDEDSGPSSNSSEEGLFSDEEIQGGGTGVGGSEASATSDDTGTL